MTGVRTVAVAVSLMLLGYGAELRAASFWPETGKPLVRAELKRFKSLRVDGVLGRFIQIDDQLFPVQSALLSGFSGARWPGGKLIYEFDSSVSSSRQLVFITSCQLWSAVARVTCLARTNQSSYVVVKASTDNNATVGMPSGKGVINIFNWDRPYVVAHEIGHSLGLAHEQSRSDRDTFVEILFQNILAGKEGNFQQQNTDYEGTSYDFDSVMHYSGTAFGKDDPSGSPSMTIKVKPPYQAKQTTIGQRNRLSASDVAGMKSRYGAP